MNNNIITANGVVDQSHFARRVYRSLPFDVAEMLMYTPFFTPNAITRPPEEAECLIDFITGTSNFISRAAMLFNRTP